MLFTVIARYPDGTLFTGALNAMNPADAFDFCRLELKTAHRWRGLKIVALVEGNCVVHEPHRTSRGCVNGTGQVGRLGE